MARTAFIGAGSTVFARNLLGDILGHEELADSEIVLHDINAERLETSELVAHRICDALEAPAKITATTDRRAALEGADYVINMIQVGGYEPCTVTDFEIPKRFGLRQTIGDTLGIGGIMRGLRTIPVLLSICADMEELCPDAWFLNYTNPMAMNCRAINRASTIRTVGLCHSVQGTAFELSHGPRGSRTGRSTTSPPGSTTWPSIYGSTTTARTSTHACRLSPNPVGFPPDNRVRYEMLRRLGYFVTESSEHFAEYVPWFIKRDRPELIDRFNIPLDEYPRRCVEQIARLGRRDGSASRETGSSKCTGASNTPRRSSAASRPVSPERSTGTSPTTGSSTICPADALSRCHASSTGTACNRRGSVPYLRRFAALIRTNVNVQELTVEAALTRRIDHVYHAAMLDPHTSAELDLDQITEMVDALIEAHGDWIPHFE